MATYIFTDFPQFKAAIGGAINQSVTMASIAPSIEETAYTHLIPWLTEPLWNALVAEVATPTATPTSTSTALNALLPYVRKSLAWLTIFEYSKIGSVMFTEHGMQRAETDNLKSAYKYQETQYRDTARRNGYNALERMLIFMDGHAADYPLWNEHGGLALNRSLLLNYAAEMRAAVSYDIARDTFEVLRPLISDLETFALLPEFGQPFLAQLKAAVLAGTPSTAQKKLLVQVRKVLANFAIAEGMQRLWVQVRNGAVVQVERLEPQSHEKAGVPGQSAMAAMFDKNSEWANRHFSYLRKYLADNIDDFPLYATYQEELATAAAAEAEAAAAADGTTTGERDASNRLNSWQNFGTSAPNGVVTF